MLKQENGGTIEFDIYQEEDLPFLLDRNLNLSQHAIMHEDVTFDEDVLTDEETCRCAKLVLERELQAAISKKVEEQQSYHSWLLGVGLN